MQLRSILFVLALATTVSAQNPPPPAAPGTAPPLPARASLSLSLASSLGAALNTPLWGLPHMAQWGEARKCAMAQASQK